MNAIVMAALGADVVANDISKESERIITSTASRLGLSNVRAITGDFVDLPFEPRSFDYVIGKALLHHLTHELESGYLAKVALLLKPDGEARFLEPATNSPLLDWLRWMVPVPGRPSSLHKRAFARWKANDPHPERDNSSEHYARVGRDYFRTVRILPIGSVERFCRLMPSGKLNRRYRRWAHRMEERLPMWLRHKTARSQVIQYRDPLA